MNPSKFRMISSWVLIILVAVLFAAGGAAKLTGQASDMFVAWGYAPWFATVIGVAELLGAIGLVIPRTFRYAVYGLTAVMLGAAYTHLANGEGLQVLRPIAFAGVMWTALWLRARAEAA